MVQSRSFKPSRISMMLISVALIIATLLTTAVASGPNVKEAFSSSCIVPYSVSVSDSGLDPIGAEIDMRLAAELAGLRCAANDLYSGVPLGIEFLGIAFDIRSAQELAAVKAAAAELSPGIPLGIEYLGIAFDIRSAEQIATASNVADGLVEEGDLGIALDRRAARDLAAAKMAVAELARRQLSADQITRMIAAQEAREAIMLGEILDQLGLISPR